MYVCLHPAVIQWMLQSDVLQKQLSRQTVSLLQKNISQLILTVALDVDSV